MRTSLRTGCELFRSKNHRRKARPGAATGFVLILAGLAGCRGSRTLGKGTPTMELTSPSFRADEILKNFTCDGANASPELCWTAPPATTPSFVLIAVDRDSPLGYSFVHSVLYDLPADKRGLPGGLPKQGQLPDGSRQGPNDFDKPGYVGPCPPGSTAHRYVCVVCA